jgi:hypothetical protein
MGIEFCLRFAVGAEQPNDLSVHPITISMLI